MASLVAFCLAQSALAELTKGPHVRKEIYGVNMKKSLNCNTTSAANISNDFSTGVYWTLLTKLQTLLTTFDCICYRFQLLLELQKS